VPRVRSPIKGDLYRGSLLNFWCVRPAESFEARLFSEDEIPWDKIAFNSVDKILRLYFDDAKTGNFPFHYIERHKQGKIP